MWYRGIVCSVVCPYLCDRLAGGVAAGPDPEPRRRIIQ
jgi:hypothetical protein